MKERGFNEGYYNCCKSLLYRPKCTCNTDSNWCTDYIRVSPTMKEDIIALKNLDDDITAHYERITTLQEEVISSLLGIIYYYNPGLARELSAKINLPIVV